MSGCLVPSLLTAPRINTSRRDSLLCAVLERYAKYHAITQKVSQLSGEQAAKAQIWETTTQACHHQPLGGCMCGPHWNMLKGKDRTQIDFLCVTMIDPATSWFEIVELSVSQPHERDIPMGTQGCKGRGTYEQQK